MPLTFQEVSEINFEFKPIRLAPGKSFLLKAFTKPEASAITFQSSDNGVLRVLPDKSNPCTEYGSCIVLAINPGKALISAKSGELRKTVAFEVFEEDIPEKNHTKMIELASDYIKLALGEVFQLPVVTNPPHRPVTWRSKNYNIADVEDGGFITAVGAGITEVVAANGPSTAVCTVEVVTLDIPEDLVEIGIGERHRIFVGTYPSTYKIIWSSSNSDIASVDFRGIVTGKSLGEVKIAAVVETETMPISKVVTVRVCPEFEPWKEFNSERLKELTIVDSSYELYQRFAGREIRKIDETATMPTLYYVRTNESPFLFEYEVAAVDKDINKFLLNW